MFRILASTLPTKEPNTHQDIGEDAVVGLGHLLCDPSAIAPITSIDRKLTLGITKKALCVFHRPLHLADMNNWVG